MLQLAGAVHTCTYGTSAVHACCRLTVWLPLLHRQVLCGGVTASMRTRRGDILSALLLPGRTESSYYAMQASKRCIAEGRVPDVVACLHDVERPLEQRIVREIFTPTDGSIQHLGETAGPFGNLRAFIIDPPGVFTS